MAEAANKPTFTKDIAFKGFVFNLELNKNEKKTVTKTATFYEIDPQDDKEQEFHFEIIGAHIKTDRQEGDATAYIKDSILLKLTKKFIANYLVITPAFGEADRKLLLLDTGALYVFAISVFRDKFTPFFLNTMAD